MCIMSLDSISFTLYSVFTAVSHSRSKLKDVSWCDISFISHLGILIYKDDQDNHCCGSSVAVETRCLPLCFAFRYTCSESYYHGSFVTVEQYPSWIFYIFPKGSASCEISYNLIQTHLNCAAGIQ